MGNKLARPSLNTAPPASPEGPEPTEDEPATGGLSHDVAWEIALAWCEQLRGCIRLETDPERRGFQMVDSFEWVTFVFNGSLAGGFKDVQDTKEAAAAARSATIAWYALSCCAGYSSMENPQFWRRVFSELYYPEYPKSGIVWLKSEPDRPQRPITEAIPFFPDPEKPFPRVRITTKSGEERTCLTAFLTTPTQAGTESQAAKLRQLLARLEPFILPSRWGNRIIPVAVDDESAVALMNDLHGEELPHSTLGIASSNELVQLRLQLIFLSASDLHLLSRVSVVLERNDMCVVIPQCDSSHLIRLGHQRAGCLLTSEASGSRRFRISTLNLIPSPNAAEDPFPRIFSALPHSQSITTVRFIHTTLQNVQLSASDWAWLGYAVFHPMAGLESSFNDLELDLTGALPDKIKIFAGMAKGNNICADFGIAASSINTTYELARVRGGTMAFSEPRDGADVLWSFASETTITLCTSAVVNNYTSLGDWVRAVVPSVGLVWIRTLNIIEITSQPAGSSCLRVLRLKAHNTSTWYTAMMSLLAIVGDELEHLDIQNSTLMDTDRVQSILRLCPWLRSLRIAHNGACWADNKAIAKMPRLPRLQQLELRLNDAGYDGSLALRPMHSTHLDDLRILRVVTLSREKFSNNRKAFLGVLARYPGLHYAHHTNGIQPKLSWEFRSYDERRKDMLAILGHIQRGVHDVCQGPVGLDCRLAFLSVIRHLGTTTDKRRWPSLQCFGPDIVRNILSFSTSPVKRDLYVDQCPPPNSSWR